ncbi:hypothetical protein FACS1894125_0170 [Actinomycetota bacterium]|nr:hypothetical protein FACS1894125_0170 [Actinomycetota bacterium]
MLNVREGGGQYELVYANELSNISLSDEDLGKHKDWDFNFSICWVNENWTKRWDGKDSDIILAQEHKETDPLEFIKDVENILSDARYIKENGRPVLTVYDVSKIDKPEEFDKTMQDKGISIYPMIFPSWDNDARRKGNGTVAFTNMNPDVYGEWLDRMLTKFPDGPVYMNSWNEWGEGAILEPSQHLGHATLVKTAEVLAKHSR